MARSTLTYGGKNLNDGSTWALMPGANFGERLKTYDEIRSYSGSVVQCNVSEANFIHMNIPLRLRGSSISSMKAEIDALNALIDAGEQNLVYNDGSGAVTYQCAHSQRVNYERTVETKSALMAFINLELVRYP